MTDAALLLEVIADAADHSHTLAAPPPTGGRVLAVIERVNPTCGDRCALTLWQVDGRVALRGEVAGCQLSRASAELLAVRVENATVAEAVTIAGAAAAVRVGTQSPDAVQLGEDVLMLASADIAPLRRRCVALAWSGVAAAQHPDA